MVAITFPDLSGLWKALGQVGQNIETSIGDTAHQLDQATLGALLATEHNVATSVGTTAHNITSSIGETFHNLTTSMGETAHGITTSAGEAAHGFSDWANQFGKMFTSTFKWILIIIAIAIIAIIVIKVM